MLKKLILSTAVILASASSYAEIMIQDLGLNVSNRTKLPVFIEVVTAWETKTVTIARPGFQPYSITYASLDKLCSKRNIPCTIAFLAKNDNEPLIGIGSVTVELKRNDKTFRILEVEQFAPTTKYKIDRIDNNVELAFVP